MTAAAFNKMSSDLTPKILEVFEGLGPDEYLTSRQIADRAIDKAGLTDKLTEEEKVNLANLYSKRVSALARPGVDKLFRDPERRGREYNYRLFRDGDVNNTEAAKRDTSAKSRRGGSRSTANANNGNEGRVTFQQVRGGQQSDTANQRVLEAMDDLDDTVVTRIAKMGMDELQAVIQLATTRITDIVNDTARELDDTRGRLEQISSLVRTSAAGHA